MTLKVTVTGSSGFLGQAVCQYLLSQAHKIQLFDHKLGLDVTDKKLVQARLCGSDAVIHLAGVLGTQELFADPYRAIKINIEGTVNILKACEKHGVRYVGITMPEVWDNVYQATKKSASLFASAWNRHCGVPVSHVRAWNAFGPGQKLFGVQKIIPTFADCAWRSVSLPIWGDGSQLVDLVYSLDVARMLVQAINFGEDQVFDAATCEPMSVEVVAYMVLAMTGSSSSLQYLPMRKGEHSVKLEAQGQGWDLLEWHPSFNEAALLNTVYSYHPKNRSLAKP